MVYTMTALLLILLNLMIAGTLSDTVIDTGAFLWVLAFALCFAIANAVQHVPSMPRWGGILLHFTLVTTGAFLFLYLPNNRGTTGSGKLMMVCILVVLYWIGMGAWMGIRVLARKLRGEGGSGRSDKNASDGVLSGGKKDTYQPLFRK